MRERERERENYSHGALFLLMPPPRANKTDIREHLKSVERGVTQKEPRFINRAVRGLQSLRKRVNSNVLRRVLLIHYPPSKLASVTVRFLSGSISVFNSFVPASPQRDPLLEFLDEPMEMGDETPPTYRPRSSKLQSGSILPELDVYVHLLVLLQQIDSSKLDKASQVEQFQNTR